MSQLFRLSKVLAVALMLLAAVRVTLGAAQPPGVGWERVFGLPVAARLFDVEMVSDSLGWAVGDEGVILRYNGAGWQAVPSPTPFRLYGMALTTPTDGWAVGDYGTVLRLSGGQWSVWPQRIPDANLFAVAMPRPDLGWAVGRAGTILTFDGSRWEQTPSPTVFPLLDVAAISPTLAVAVGSGGTILRYQNGVWAAESSPTGAALRAVAFNSPTDGWAVGDAGVILHFDGATWTPVASPVTDILLSLLMVAPDDIWAAGQSGLLIHFDGADWAQMSSPTQYSLYALEEAPGGDLWAAGFGSTILHYTAGQWQHAPGPTPQTLRDIVWDNTEAWAVGDAGAILHYGGGNWAAETAPTGADLHAVGRAGPNSLWAGGSGGTLLSFTGTTWTLATSPTTLTVRGMAFVDTAAGWAVGGDARPAAGWSAGVILRFDGAGWQTESAAPPEPLYGVAFAAPDTGWAVGRGGTIWRYRGGAWAAGASPTRLNLRAVAAAGPAQAWAVGERGVILRFDGQGWREVDSPTVRGLHRLVMSGPAEGWAFGDSGLILHFDGLGWREVNSPTAQQLLGAAPDNAGTVWAVGSGGTLLYRPRSGGDFTLTAAPNQARPAPGQSAPVAVALSAVDGFSAPVTLTLSAAPQNVTAPFSTATVVPPISLTIELALDAPLPEQAIPFTLTAAGNGLTRTATFSLTPLPGQWMPQTTLTGSGRLHDLAAGPGGTVWAVGDDGAAWRLDSSGWFRFASLGAGNLYAVAAISSSRVWAAGEGGALYTYNGQTWLAATSPATMPLHALASDPSGAVWAVGGGGTVLRYTGGAWQAAAAPAADWLYGLDFAPDGSGWAVGWGGAIWRFDGQNWQVADSPTRSWLRAVTALSPGNAWAAGSEGTVLHYTGGQWEPVSAPTTARLFDVWFNSPTDGWAAGGDGVVLRYNGREWYAAPLPATPRETLGSITPPGGTGSLAPAPQPAADLRALAFTPAGQGVAVGSGGQVVCFQPAQTGSGNINCGGGAVVQTAELARHFYLPLMGKNSWSRQPIDLFGVQTVGGTFSRDPAIVFQMAEAGVRWARMPFSWKLIEPANTTPDRYRWSYHDDWFELLVAAGIRPMPFVARNPSWAGTFAAREIDRADEAEQEEFVGAAVSRYGRPPFNVTHWELYNEPDNADPHLSEVGWATWGNNPAGYADQLARLYPVIKAANPSSRVLLGGLGHTFFADTGGFFVRGFITDVVRAGGGNYFDILNFHYYGPDFSGQIDYFDDFLARFGLDKPLVCTEISHLEGSPVVEGQGELHARYLPQAMARGIAGSLPIVDWFAVADMEGMWRSGLFALDRTPRPAYTAYRVLTTVLGPARYARPLSPAEISGLPLEGYVFDTPGSGRLDVVWATQDTVVSWPVRAGWVTLTNKYGGARTVLDASDGRTDGRTTVRVGVNPLYVQYGSR